MSASPLDQQAAQNGDDRQRRRQRAGQGKADRHRQRLEHLALHRLQCEQRHEDDDDDENSEDDGPRHLADGLQGDLSSGQVRLGLLAHVACDVLHDDDRAVYDHAYGNGQSAQTHQVRRHPLPVHQQECRCCRHRKRQRHRQCRPQVPQHHEQDQDDKDRPLPQRRRDGLDARLDQVRTVVERLNPHARGEGLLDLRDLGADAVDHLLGVGAPEHDGHTDNRLAPAVPGHHALSRLVPQADLRHVLQIHGRAVLGIQDNPLDVGKVPHQALRDHVDLLPVLNDEAPTGIGVVGLQRVQNVPQGDTVLQQQVRVGNHVELLYESAEAVYLVYAAQTPQLRADQPVLNRPQLHQVRLGAEQLGAAVLAGARRVGPDGIVLGAVVPGLQNVLVDLPEAARDRAELGLDALGQLLAGVGQALKDQLACKVRVDVVLKDHHHLRQATLRHRPDLLDVRQPPHLDLDGEGHQALDLARRQARRVGDNHHLHVGHVGESVDGEVVPRQHPRPQQDDRRQDDQQLLPQHEPKYVSKHRMDLSLSCLQ